MSDELDVDITIRDLNWIIGNLNKSTSTIAAYETYAAPLIADLQTPGASQIISRIQSEELRTAFVFLSQEVENRRGNADLLQAVGDSLILRGLRNTSPRDEKNILMTRDQILMEVEKTIPSAHSFMPGIIDHRLSIFISKSAPGGRKVTTYKGTKQFCLPFETRKIVASENAAAGTGVGSYSPRRRVVTSIL
jgi:hypothetical protein